MLVLSVFQQDLFIFFPDILKILTSGVDREHSLTPGLTCVPFRDVAISTAFFTHSRYSKILAQKWLLSLNSFSLQMVS